jgi:hypothetical protein
MVDKGEAAPEPSTSTLSVAVIGVEIDASSFGTRTLFTLPMEHMVELLLET